MVPGFGEIQYHLKCRGCGSGWEGAERDQLRSLQLSQAGGSGGGNGRCLRGIGRRLGFMYFRSD